MTMQMKGCPKCGQANPLGAPQCACGHVFRTSFQQPPPGQPQYPQPPPAQPSYQQPPPAQPQYQQPPPAQPQYQQPPPVQPPYQQPPTQPYYQQPPPVQPPYPYAPAPPPAPDAIQVPPGTHSVALAVMLSFFLIGVGGQFYNRQYLKAVALIAGHLVLGVVLFLFAFVTFGVGILLWGLPGLLSIVWVVDAGMVANRLNRGEAVGQWKFF